MSIDLRKASGSAPELFLEILEQTARCLAPENSGAFDIPEDELHQEILVPLLPALLSDKAIRGYWRDQKTRGIFARLAQRAGGDVESARWEPDDFEIHVTASYLAGADAKALA